MCFRVFACFVFARVLVCLCDCLLVCLWVRVCMHVWACLFICLLVCVRACVRTCAPAYSCICELTYSYSKALVVVCCSLAKIHASSTRTNTSNNSAPSWLIFGLPEQLKWPRPPPTTTVTMYPPTRMTCPATQRSTFVWEE